MRRIVAVLTLLLTFSTASYGADSEDMSVYVRKDVFEVYMQNINTNMDRILNKLDNLEKIANENTAAISALSARIDGVNSSLSARIDGVNSLLSAKIDEVNSSLSARIDGVEASLSARIDGVEASLSAQIKGTNVRIDDLRNGMYLWLVVIGTIISAIVAWPKVKEVIQTRNAGGKNFTLEDVMRLIEENNAKLNISSQNK